MKALEDCMKQQRANEGMESRGISPTERENPPLVTECRQETISADISAPAGHTETETSGELNRVSTRWVLNSAGLHLQWLYSMKNVFKIKILKCVIILPIYFIIQTRDSQIFVSSEPIRCTIFTSSSHWDFKKIYILRNIYMFMVL